MRSDPETAEDPTGGGSDRALLEALREGDSEAYATLWERHYPAALRAARQYDHNTEAEDIAQEAFARVLDAVRQGNGPQESFRAYLLRAVSNVAQNAARARRRTMVSDDHSVLDSPVLYDDPAIAELEQHFIAQAYQRLSRPQRELLWYVEVEQLQTKQAAEYLGMTENTAAKASGRAREALKREYLQLHVEQRGDTPDCGPALARMARYVRGSLSVTQRRKVDAHIGDCAHCAFALAELTEIGRGLQVVVAPLVVGTVGTAAGYLASTTGDKAIAIAIGAGTTTGGGTAAAGGAGGTPPTGANNVTRVAVMTVGVILAVSGISLAAVLTSGGGDQPAAEQAVEPPGPGGGGAGSGSGGGSSGNGGGGGGSADSQDDDPDPERQQPSDPAPDPEDEPDPGTPDSPPDERRPAPEPEPTSIPTPSPTQKPDPTPTHTRPTPSDPPSPTPTLPTPTSTSPSPPPEEPEVEVHRLTGGAWDAEPGVAYAAISGADLEPGEEATLWVRATVLASVSEPTGTISSAPPLPPDDTWDCFGADQLGYRCTASADADGSVTAAVQATDTALPFNGQLTVELITDSGTASDQMSIE